MPKETVTQCVSFGVCYCGVSELFNTTNCAGIAAAAGGGDEGRKKRRVVQCVEPHANALVFTHNCLAQKFENTGLSNSEAV